MRRLVLLFLVNTCCALAAEPTDWQVKPSLKFDTLCLLNVLSGDPYYLKYYQREYDHFHPLFTAGEQAAFETLKRVIKDEGGGIVSAKLALYFSTVEGETLDDMIRTAHDGAAMKAALHKTPTGARTDGRITKRPRPRWRPRYARCSESIFPNTGGRRPQRGSRSALPSWGLI